MNSTSEEQLRCFRRIQQLKSDPKIGSLLSSCTKSVSALNDRTFEKKGSFTTTNDVYGKVELKSRNRPKTLSTAFGKRDFSLKDTKSQPLLDVQIGIETENDRGLAYANKKPKIVSHFQTLDDTYTEQKMENNIYSIGKLQSSLFVHKEKRRLKPDLSSFKTFQVYEKAKKPILEIWQHESANSLDRDRKLK